jgi:hypothetical protein
MTCRTLVANKRFYLIAGLVMALFASAALTQACGPADVKPNPRTLTRPFTARTEGADGSVVELQGYADGYRPGQEVSYGLRLQNGGEGGWQGRYCLLLLNEAGTLATLAGDTFALQPGEGLETTLKCTLPEDLPDGEYGLALVIPDRLSSVITVTVGQVDSPAGPPSRAGELPEPAGSRWPQPACPG